MVHARRYMSGFLFLLSMLLFGSCSSGPTREDITLVVPKRARYADEITVPPDYAKCQLEEKVAKVVAKAARLGYSRIETKPHVDHNMPGHVLTLMITNVGGVDRALYDSRALTVNGILYVDGQEKTSFMARRRSSRRGLQIKTTCQMLNKSIGEIHQDLERWFANPVPGARLGDL